MRRGTPKTKSEKVSNRLQSAKRMVTHTKMATQGKNCSQTNMHLEKHASSTKQASKRQLLHTYHRASEASNPSESGQQMNPEDAAPQSETPTKLQAATKTGKVAAPSRLQSGRPCTRQKYSHNGKASASNHAQSQGRQSRPHSKRKRQAILNSASSKSNYNTS